MGKSPLRLHRHILEEVVLSRKHVGGKFLNSVVELRCLFCHLVPELLENFPASLIIFCQIELSLQFNERILRFQQCLVHTFLMHLDIVYFCIVFTENFSRFEHLCADSAVQILYFLLTGVVYCTKICDFVAKFFLVLPDP